MASPNEVAARRRAAAPGARGPVRGVSPRAGCGALDAGALDVDGEVVAGLAPALFGDDLRLTFTTGKE